MLTPVKRKSSVYVNVTQSKLQTCNISRDEDGHYITILNTMYLTTELQITGSKNQ